MMPPAVSPGSAAAPRSAARGYAAPAQQSRRHARLELAEQVRGRVGAIAATNRTAWSSSSTWITWVLPLGDMSPACRRRRVGHQREQLGGVQVRQAVSRRAISVGCSRVTGGGSRGRPRRLGSPRRNSSSFQSTSLRAAPRPTRRGRGGAPPPRAGIGAGQPKLAVLLAEPRSLARSVWRRPTSTIRASMMSRPASTCAPETRPRRPPGR